MDGQARIDSVFAFVVVDDDGTEGVPAIESDGVAYPLMGADLAMVEILKPHARALAKQTGKPVALVHFSRRTLQEIYQPDGTVAKE